MILKRIVISLAVCILGLCMTSCAEPTDYRYVISNKCSETITLEFLPQDWAEWELERGDLSWPYIAVYLLGDGYEKIDDYRSPFELKPGESLMFSWIDDSMGLRNRENPLWKKNHLIDKILIGEDLDDSQKEISEDYWSNRENWIIREKESEYVEYWLDIDDEVINNNYTPINNHR